MAAWLSSLCAPCWACLRRQGFQKLVDLVEYSERGEFDVDESIELQLPASSGVDSKRGWLDLKIGVALVWTHTYCILKNGSLELYSTEADSSDHSSPDFQGEIDLCGALLLAARSSSYVEIRNDIGSFYFKMNSANQFESWRCAIKREIEYCNWVAFIDGGGDTEAMPPDLVEWFDRLQASRDKAVQELSEGTLITKHFTALGFRRSHHRILKVLCGESRDAEMTIILNEEPAATAESPPPPVDRTLRPCDEDKVLWTAPSNEANIDEPENKGVSEVMFMSIKAILKGTSESPVLCSLKYPEPKARKCFSIVSTSNKMYDFEAATVEEGESWVRGLFFILKYNTLVTRALRHAKTPVTKSRRQSKQQLKKALHGAKAK